MVEGVGREGGIHQEYKEGEMGKGVNEERRGEEGRGEEGRGEKYKEGEMGRGGYEEGEESSRFYYSVIKMEVEEGG